MNPSNNITLQNRGAVQAPHSQDASVVASLLQVDPAAGLGEAEASHRLTRTGSNTLPETPGRSPWLVFASQFKSVLVLILLGAEVLAAPASSLRDAVVILALREITR